MYLFSVEEAAIALNVAKEEVEGIMIDRGLANRSLLHSGNKHAMSLVEEMDEKLYLTGDGFMLVTESIYFI